MVTGGWRLAPGLGRQGEGWTGPQYWVGSSYALRCALCGLACNLRCVVYGTGRAGNIQQGIGQRAAADNRGRVTQSQGVQSRGLAAEGRMQRACTSRPQSQANRVMGNRNRHHRLTGGRACVRARALRQAMTQPAASDTTSIQSQLRAVLCTSCSRKSCEPPQRLGESDFNRPPCFVPVGQATQLRPQHRVTSADDQRKRQRIPGHCTLRSVPACPPACESATRTPEGHHKACLINVRSARSGTSLRYPVSPQVWHENEDRNE